MGEATGISWADHTFNPWIGCTKVSEACRNCYAERDNAFRKWNGGTWGPGAPRKVTSEANWRKPLQWNHKAILDGVRRRVFTASLADVFDSEAPADAQARLFDLIEECAALDWLVLTKRPENALAFSLKRVFPANVWIGTSVENQKAADERIPFLLQIPATVRFLSMEPLLGPVDLWAALHPHGTEARECPTFYDGCNCNGIHGIAWVITGGESGSQSRPTHPDWFRSLRDECASAGVAYHHKQNGEWLPFYDRDVDDPDWRYVPKDALDVTRLNLAGGQGFHGERVVYLRRVGKKKAGRLLDGVEWNQFPEVANASR